MIRCLCGATTADDAAELRAGRGDHRDGSPCEYVPCDQAECRAKDNPKDGHEWRESALHWRRHRYLGGCSHGR